MLVESLRNILTSSLLGLLSYPFPQPMLLDPKGTTNPDLVEKLRNNLPLVPPDMNTFYAPDEKGYTDY